MSLRESFAVEAGFPPPHAVKPSESAAPDPRAQAAAAGLRYVSDTTPGITRHQHRLRGFQYRDSAGRLIRDAALLQRIKSLAIPPAWTDVWICPNPQGHLQATGHDARGRKQ